MHVTAFPWTEPFTGLALRENEIRVCGISLWTLLRSSGPSQENLESSLRHLAVDVLLVAPRPGPLLHVRFLCSMYFGGTLESTPIKYLS
jgi:hypothetical protein